MTSLIQQTLDARCQATAMLCDYVAVRANTLKLDHTLRARFREAAIRHWWAGIGSVEKALRAAADEVCNVCE